MWLWVLVCLGLVGAAASLGGCGDRPWYQKRLVVVVLETFPDSHYEAPLPGCTVTVSETNESLITDSHGQAVFFLDPGDYTVTVSKSGYTTARVMVSITYLSDGTVTREVRVAAKT